MYVYIFFWIWMWLAELRRPYSLAPDSIRKWRVRIEVFFDEDKAKIGARA